MKRFERNAETGLQPKEGILRLMGYDVDIVGSQVLLSVDCFDDALLDKHFSVKTGTWHTEEGWVVGKNPEMCPGTIVSREDFPGNVMLERTVKMVAPSTHDINIMINGEWRDWKPFGMAM